MHLLYETSYLKVYQNDNSILNGTNIFDFRLSLKPFKNIPQFRFLTEYVKQDNGVALDAQAWYVNVAYLFIDSPWQPKFSYRYASLEGNNPNTVENESYDMLSYGISDWGTWFQGEILGQYVFLGKSNLNSHRVQFKIKPKFNLTLSLSYYQFLSDQPASRGITRRHFADELDLILNWNINKTSSIHGVLGLSIPGDGAKEMTGGSKNWALAMIYISLKF
jgi:hypothetical protein